MTEAQIKRHGDLRVSEEYVNSVLRIFLVLPLSLEDKLLENIIVAGDDTISPK